MTNKNQINDKILEIENNLDLISNMTYAVELKDIDITIINNCIQSIKHNLNNICYILQK